MTAENINQLIDDKQFSAALRLVDTGEQITEGIKTEQASQLLRYMANHGMLERAISLAESYLEYHSEDAEIHFLLGNTALKLGDVEKAMLHLERANTITPNKPLILANLSVGYNAMDQHGEAIRVLEQAANLHPQYAFAHQKMGSVLCKAGQVKRGMRAFERAMMLSPDPHYMFARLLYWKNYLAESRPETIYADAKTWGGQFTHTFEKGVGVHLNDLAHQKRLNVGFVSPDFCAHPVSFFAEPLFTHLDRDKFKVFAYSDVAQPDKVTEWLQKEVDVYHPTAGKDVQSVARMILDDRIDVLFDLAGHTGSGRLDLFHLRPAPVQISWLGYPATTGSTGIDYRLTDRYADPAPDTDKYYTEKLLRVEGGFLCYVPSERTPEPTDISPCIESGIITFGSFNNLAKLSDQCIQMWAEILARVPDSVLLIKRRELKDQWVKNYYIEQFAQHGIPKKRLQFKTSQTRLEGHLRNYAKVDIALDSYPYNGTTTTFEALWMNVPVISLGGDTHASRVGQSILRYAGLDELAAQTPEQYIVQAASLAQDQNRLAHYHKTLRASLEASSLTDQQRFADNVSRILRDQWIRWSTEQQEEKRIILEDEA